jgi:hypothetical protein
MNNSPDKKYQLKRNDIDYSTDKVPPFNLEQILKFESSYDGLKKRPSYKMYI